MSALVIATFNFGHKTIWTRYGGLSLASWLYALVPFLALTGLLWDGAWHRSFGRDSFFIPPHDVMYGGLMIGLALTYGIIILSSRQPRNPAFRRFLSLQAPPGVWVAFVGLFLVLAAAPYDDWWHANIGHVEGRDPVLWSPPHLLGVIGALITFWGILAFLLREVKLPSPGIKPKSLVGLSLNNLSLLLIFTWILFLLGGISLDRFIIFHTYRTDGSIYPILAMTLSPGLLVIAQRVLHRWGTATFLLVVPFIMTAGVGAILLSVGYPYVASLPMMALPSAILLDLAYARLGDGKRWLLWFGSLFVLVFFVGEYFWSWYLNGAPWTNLIGALIALPVACVAATASMYAGALLAPRIENWNRSGYDNAGNQVA